MPPAIAPMTTEEAIRAWMERRPLFGDVRRRALEAMREAFLESMARVLA